MGAAEAFTISSDDYLRQQQPDLFLVGGAVSPDAARGIKRRVDPMHAQQTGAVSLELLRQDSGAVLPDRVTQFEEGLHAAHPDLDAARQSYRVGPNI